MERYNLVVLGAESGGLTVAGGAALVGARVALLEKHRMGGDCLNYGCVPSKAFLRVAKVAQTTMCTPHPSTTTTARSATVNPKGSSRCSHPQGDCGDSRRSHRPRPGW